MADGNNNRVVRLDDTADRGIAVFVKDTVVGVGRLDLMFLFPCKYTVLYSVRASVVSGIVNTAILTCTVRTKQLMKPKSQQRD